MSDEGLDTKVRDIDVSPDELLRVIAAWVKVPAVPEPKSAGEFSAVLLGIADRFERFQKALEEIAKPMEHDGLCVWCFHMAEDCGPRCCTSIARKALEGLR